MATLHPLRTIKIALLTLTTIITRQSIALRVTPSMSASTVASNLAEVQHRISSSVSGNEKVRLVAVSKTKPSSMILECYESGQIRFGENYVQELIAKANFDTNNDTVDVEVPRGVEWHFIGSLQSNKAANLVKGVGTALKVVETLASMKLADKLNRAVEEVRSNEEDAEDYKLGVYIQVNTSGEDSKSGISSIEDVVSLAKDIQAQCPNLDFQGLMTIGSPGDVSCFDKLVQYRADLVQELGVDSSSLELSMGMSGDFEEAIKRGATNVRVGSTIFGLRDYSNANK